MPPESPLRALLEAIGEQLHELEEAIEGLYEDAFVETPRRWWPPGFLAALVLIGLVAWRANRARCRRVRNAG